MRFERDADQREAEAGAVVLCGEVRLEHALAQLGGDAGTVIANRDGEPPAVSRDGDVDRTGPVHCLGGIAGEGRESTTQRLVMAKKPARAPIPVPGDAYALRDAPAPPLP